MNKQNVLLIVSLFILKSCGLENKKNQYSTIILKPEYLINLEDSILLEKEGKSINKIYTGLGKGEYIDEFRKYYMFDSLLSGEYQIKYSNIFNELVVDTIYVKEPIHQIKVKRTKLNQLTRDYDFLNLIVDTLEVKVIEVYHGTIETKYSFWLDGSEIFYRINKNKEKRVLSVIQKEFLNRFYQELQILNKKQLMSSKYDKYLIIRNNDTTSFKDSDQLWHGREKLYRIMKSN